jgi:outer membrane protein TolC
MRKSVLALAVAVNFMVLIPEQAAAQNTTLKFTLDEVINLAREQSRAAILAKHRFRGSYWQYRTYKAKFLPGLTLSSTIPDMTRSIDRITLPDGSDAFVERKVANSTMDLSLTQNIAFTGGSIFMSSSLQRIDLLGAVEEPTSYLSTPVSIGFRQPIKAPNSFKWEKRIEPLRYEEARKDYIDAMEQVSQRAVTYFFNLALAQVNLQVAEINFNNNDTLYRIAQGRYNIGTIAENDLLQMELGLLNAGTALNEAKIQLEMQKFQLRSFLGYNETVDIQLIVPDSIPELEVDVAFALNEAKNNSPEIISLQRQLLEASRDVAQARAEKGLTANLYATFGLTQRDQEIAQVYNNTQDQERVRVGLEIPVIDWGLGKGNYRMAQSNQEVVKTNVQQAEIDFEQEVMLQVMQFNLQDDQLRIAAKADTIAQSRYDVTKQRFLIGNVNVLDLNVALTEKDTAKRGYLAALHNYWSYFYNIRRLTLFDFIEGVPLSAQFDELLQ